MTIPWNFIGYYSLEEWREIIDDWEKSKVSKHTYCRVKKIPYRSFCEWHHRLYPLNPLSRKEVRERWERIVKNWEKSGLRKAAYCKKKGLNISTFCLREREFNPHTLRKTSHEKAVERWAPIIEDWKKSGLNKFAYCRKHRFIYSVLCKWVKKFDDTLQLPSDLRKGSLHETSLQVPVDFSFPPSSPLKGPTLVNQKLEVTLSQGQYFCMEGPFDWPKLTAWLTPLLKR